MKPGAVTHWLAKAPGGVSGEPGRGRFDLAGVRCGRVGPAACVDADPAGIRTFPTSFD